MEHRHELTATARALVAPGQGHPRRRRERAARSRSASTRSASSPPRTTGATTARCCSRTDGRGRLHQRRDPLRRDDPPVGRRRHAVLEAARTTRGSSPASRSTPAPSRCALADGETVTEGLDGLRERLAEYHGARRALRQVARDVLDHRRAAVAATASTSTRTRSRATRRCARKPASCRSSSPRC